MKNWTEKEIENLIKNSAFPNPAHKKALRQKLFEPVIELSLDDLDAAAGGVMLSETENRKPWQMGEECRK